MMINRSIGGNIVIFLFLALASIFMLLPIVYTVVTAFKPMNEIFLYPPRFWVKNPTTDNFATMAELAGEMWVPFERYLYNSIIVAVLGTVIYIFVASMAAYPLAKRKTKGMAIYYPLSSSPSCFGRKLPRFRCTSSWRSWGLSTPIRP